MKRSDISLSRLRMLSQGFDEIARAYILVRILTSASSSSSPKAEATLVGADRVELEGGG